jgi:TfoX/Sxy family transcriptional regulator of competence genes
MTCPNTVHTGIGVEHGHGLRSLVGSPRGVMPRSHPICTDTNGPGSLKAGIRTSNATLTGDSRTMPFDAGLATRLEDLVARDFSHISGLEETRMFGGFGYLLHGNMCMGIHKDTLIVRVGVERANELLAEPHVRPMDLTGRVMKGWATIESEALEDDHDLARFCRAALDFAATLPPKR